MTIGKTIKRLRDSRGMTQEQLAEKLGVGASAVSAWENGAKTPRMGAIEKMSGLICGTIAFQK